MSVPSLVKAIHQLTYLEMCAVAAELSTAIMMLEAKRTPDKSVQGPIHEDVAHAMLSLRAASDVLGQEDKLLRQLFSRKRSISVELKSGGWYTDITTLDAAKAAGVSLRESLNKTIDQIVTMQALRPK